MKKAVFLVFLVLSVRLVSAQQVRVDSLCQKAYSEIMSLHFAPAKQLLQQEKQAYPGNVYVDYLENYKDFLRIFIGENKNLFNRLEDTFDIRYNRIKELPDTSRYKNLMLANMNLQWAFARLKFGQYFTAAWELNRAYRLLTGNKERFPDFIPQDISLGVLHIMIGLVPDKYHWMLKIISMQGSVERGKAEIYRALDSAASNPRYAYLYPEALFYLGFVELNLSPDSQALKQLIRYLEKTDNSNLLMDFLKADIYIRHGQNERALKQLERAPQGNGYFPFYYLSFLKGDCYLRKLEYDSADAAYRYFLNHFEGLNYIKDAWRKRAWTALLQNQPALYRQRMDSVTVYGDDKVGADKEALEEAQASPIPNKNLLRARLLFDGGYYLQAKHILDTMDTANLTNDENAERIYRYARIAHRQRLWATAKKEYRRAILTGAKSHRYFAANAALKLGEIYESEDSLKTARQFYNQCLEMDFDEYVNSIRGKAKEALERISEKESATNGN